MFFEFFVFVYVAILDVKFKVPGLGVIFSVCLRDL